jgi:hypothetical protein
MTSKRFHDNMVKFLGEYREYLLLIKLDRIAVSHYAVIHEFIDFIYKDHKISSFAKITVSITNTKFLSKYNRHRSDKDVISKQRMKNILSGFFIFLYGKHRIINKKLMRGLENN